MWINILIGCSLILLTTFLHGLTTRYVMHLAARVADSEKKRLLRFKEYLVSAVVLIMFLATTIEALFWAISYLLLGAIENIESSVYFSLVTYTTLGYGDITLAEDWRLVAGFEAANGIIIFGWSTAIVMAVVQKLYSHSGSEKV